MSSTKKRKHADTSGAQGPTPPEPAPGAPPASEEAVPPPQAVTVPIVAIGASAGGLEALQTFFANMPPDSGAAFVLIQHLSPDYKSMMAEILQQSTPMETRRIEDGMPVAPNKVYANPPGKDLLIENGILRLVEPEKPRGHSLPIDRFFHSLAEDQKEKVVCILMSGTGSDGARSLKAVKGYGGLTFAQDGGARYKDMPQNAIATGMVDYVLYAEEMPAKILELIRNRPTLPLEPGATPETQETRGYIKKILRRVKLKTGHDFSRYKPDTVARRIERRMALLQLREVRDYVAYLKNNDAERKLLFQELLIGVTIFFRDKEPFEILAKVVIPRIFAGKSDADAIRVWVAGCATGEDAYSLAMLLAEHMHAAGKMNRVQLFATDIDEESLEFARNGRYPQAIEADVAPERLGRFFLKEGDEYRIAKSIREMVVFAPHSLIRDPPYSRIDLISCRNLLLSLAPDLQQKVLPLFHYALSPQGFLFLGPSESVTEQTDLFEPVDLKWNIFQRKGNTPGRLPEIPLLPTQGQAMALEKPKPVWPQEQAPYLRQAQQLLVNRFVAPSVVVNDDYEPLQFFGQVDRYFAVTAGESIKSVLLLAREGLRPSLRPAIHAAMKENETVRRLGLTMGVGARTETFDLIVTPLREDGKAGRLFLVSFEHVGWSDGPAEAQPTCPPVGCESLVANLEQELKATRTELQTTVEELESVNEELMSRNEELQSSDEELETSREELHSINEELTTVNAAMQHKVDDLGNVNTDLQNFINSSRIATLFLDKELTVRCFTPQVTEFFSILPVDMGRPFAHLRPRIEYEEVLGDIRQVLGTLTPLERHLTLQDGRRILARIIPYPYRASNDRIEGVVLTLVDVTSVLVAEQRLSQQAAELETLYKTIPDMYFRVGPDDVILNCRSTDEPDIIPNAEAVAGKRFGDIFPSGDALLLEGMLKEAREADAQRSLDLHFAAGGRERHLEVRIIPVGQELFVVMRDMAGPKLVEDRLRFQADALSQVSDAIIAVDTQGVIILWNAGAERLLGIPAARAMGQPLEAIDGVKWIVDRDETVVAMTPRDERPWVRELDHVRDDGATIAVESSASVLYNRQGDKVGLLAILRDVSENKRFAQGLLEAKQKAEAANRAKSEFLANMSHEIRTPMNGILGMTQLALNRELPDDVREFLQLVHQSGLSLLDIINDILDLAKIEADRVVLEKKPFDLVTLVEASLAPLELMARDKGLTFLFSIAPAVPGRVVGDKGRLRQILTNVVGNAIKFTKRGRVEVNVRLADTANPQKIRLLFVIKDEGIGISPAKIRSIFEKFEQISTSAHIQYGGTGLGLAIAKALVELMGGTIAVESEVDKGSTFSLVVEFD